MDESVVEFFVYKYYFVDAANGNCAGELANNLDLTFLPMMTRRKFSTLNKIALFTIYKCYDNYNNGNVNLVFASRYGEFERLLKLIAQYKEENGVSPISFSSSVHNATAGIFSLLNKITKPYNAISAGENTLSNGFLDAALDVKKSDVLFCYADSLEKNQSVSCLIGTQPREGAVKIRFVKGNSGCNNDEFTSFIDFLSGKTSKFNAGFYSLEKVE